MFNRQYIDGREVVKITCNHLYIAFIIKLQVLQPGWLIGF